MSFTASIKNECTQIETATCCKKALLSVLIRMTGTVEINPQLALNISTENAAVARLTFSLCKSVLAIQPEVMVRKKARLKKNNVYMLKLNSSVGEILEDLYIMNLTTGERFNGIEPILIKKSCCKKSYLRGAFLAGGSINNPDSASYHMEIISLYQDHCKGLHKLLKGFHLNAKILERKKGFIVYVKEGDKIGDFLNIIGAHPSLLKFEDVRILKDMRNSVNRLVNCETANLNKTIQAAIRQIENIQLIERFLGLDRLSPRLRRVAEVRINYPEATLAELGQLIDEKLSKSAISHRLRKIETIAEQLSKGSLGNKYKEYF